uniref:Uncharacterized protein n=1 Tax=Arundo donax TaxID=35708 RepID=A0A0A9CJ66_ARUDO
MIHIFGSFQVLDSIQQSRHMRVSLRVRFSSDHGSGYGNPGHPASVGSSYG